MIDRLFRGLEFDFSFRGQEDTYRIAFRFCISFGFFFRILYFSFLKKSTPAFLITCRARYSRIVASGDFLDASIAVKGCHREENARRSFSIERIISALRLKRHDSFSMGCIREHT